MITIEGTNLYTAEEVATRLKIGTRTVWRYRAAGTLEGRKHGRQVLFPETVISGYLRDVLGIEAAAPATDGKARQKRPISDKTEKQK